ncbi:Hypothetical predicted protein [Paramuricea clavata]|uniref:Uncharacterized protein n=1 Tax=Paramuricea clavata TaxID=317549 RepID=A0A7D9EUP2_PARCT|nr:Hypothetical predicted protein [Paramuricea clavata]
MSTNKRKFASKITFNSNDVDHAAQLLSDKAELVLEIPQEILIHWHSLKGKASKGDLTECKNVNFVTSIPELPFKVLRNSCLEKRIADLAWLAKRETHGKSAVLEQQHADVDLDNRCSELFSQLTEAREKLQNVDSRLNSCEAERDLLKRMLPWQVK